MFSQFLSLFSQYPQQSSLLKWPPNLVRFSMVAPYLGFSWRSGISILPTFGEISLYYLHQQTSHRIWGTVWVTNNNSGEKTSSFSAVQTHQVTKNKDVHGQDHRRTVAQEAGSSGEDGIRPQMTVEPNTPRLTFYPLSVLAYLHLDPCWPREDGGTGKAESETLGFQVQTEQGAGIWGFKGRQEALLTSVSKVKYSLPASLPLYLRLRLTVCDPCPGLHAFPESPVCDPKSVRGENVSSMKGKKKIRKRRGFFCLFALFYLGFSGTREGIFVLHLEHSTFGAHTMKLSEVWKHIIVK